MLPTKRTEPVKSRANLIVLLLMAIALMGCPLPPSNAPAADFIIPMTGINSGLVQNGHKALDISTYSNNQPMYAMAAGTIVRVQSDPKPGTNSGFGHNVVLRTDNGYYIYYTHLAGWSVNNRQRVNRGDLIGISGDTGHTNGRDHLHLEIFDQLWQRHYAAGLGERLHWTNDSGRRELTPFRTAPYHPDFGSPQIRLININEAVPSNGHYQVNNRFNFNPNPPPLN